MPPIRLTRKQAARLLGEDVPAQKPRKPRQERRTESKPTVAVVLAVGKKYRVVRGIPADNPPRVGTVLTAWRILSGYVYLEEHEAGGYMLAVTPEQLGRYFEEVTAE